MRTLLLYRTPQTEMEELERKKHSEKVRRKRKYDSEAGWEIKRRKEGVREVENQRTKRIKRVEKGIKKERESEEQ